MTRFLRHTAVAVATTGALTAGLFTSVSAAAPTDLNSCPVQAQGLAGPCVKLLQDALNRYGGAHLKVDGIFGPLTRAAVMSFQHSHHLKADGQAGQQTDAALTVRCHDTAPGITKCQHLPA